MTVIAPVEGMTIAEAAERTGLTPHTLRYYERDGLMLHGVGRTSSGHRVYTDRDLTWVTMLTRLRARGCRSARSRRTPRCAARATGRRPNAWPYCRPTAPECSRSRRGPRHLEAIDVKIDMYASRVARADA